MQNMIINVEASSGLDGKFQQFADRPMMRTRWGSCAGGIPIKKYQAQKGQSDWRR